MKKILIVFIFIISFVTLGYYYISGLPQYTFFLIYKAIKNHDVESFYKYVDVDSIIDNFMNDAWKEAMLKEQLKDEWEALGMGLAQAMKPVVKSMFTDLAKREINNAIEDIKQPSPKDAPVEETPVKYFMDRFKSLKQLSKIKIRTVGKVTEIEIPSFEKEQSLFLKMRKTPQRYWKIIAIKIPYTEETREVKQVETKPETRYVLTDSPIYLNYYQLIREKIKRSSYQNYTITDKGEVSLSVILLNNGGLKEVKVDENKTRGSQKLKEIAMRSVKEASPFPPFPEELKEYPELNFNVVLSFEIE